MPRARSSPPAKARRQPRRSRCPSSHSDHRMVDGPVTGRAATNSAQAGARTIWVKCHRKDLRFRPCFRGRYRRSFQQSRATPFNAGWQRCGPSRGQRPAGYLPIAAPRNCTIVDPLHALVANAGLVGHLHLDWGIVGSSADEAKWSLSEIMSGFRPLPAGYPKSQIVNEFGGCCVQSCLWHAQRVVWMVNQIGF